MEAGDYNKARAYYKVTISYWSIICTLKEVFLWIELINSFGDYLFEEPSWIKYACKFDINFPYVQEAIRLKPNFADAHLNQGNVLKVKMFHIWVG